MIEPESTLDIIKTLKLTLLVIIPIGILTALIYYFKNKSLKDKIEQVDKMTSIKDDMEKLAEDKKLERIDKPNPEETSKLDKDEIRKEIESKRQDFDEHELTTPLMDLSDEEDFKSKGELHES